MSSLAEYLIEQIRGKIPKNLRAGEELDVYSDGTPGPGGVVGNRKIDKHNGKRHFSISYMKKIRTKLVDGELTDQYGTPIDKIRNKYDIERTAKRV
jgi:hypothetical protein